MTTETTPAPEEKSARKPRRTGGKSKPAAVRKTNEDGKVVLKAICSQMRIEPRIARRRLRAAGLGFHGKRERWVFTPSQAERVKSVLRPS